MMGPLLRAWHDMHSICTVMCEDFEHLWLPAPDSIKEILFTARHLSRCAEKSKTVMHNLFPKEVYTQPGGAHADLTDTES